MELERQTVPYFEPFDPNYRRLQYVRYADDFLIGVIGSKEDALEIKRKVREFTGSVLHLELSEEKTLITHSAKRARFLGYDIFVRRSKATKRNKLGHLRRHLNGTVCLELPMEVMRKKLLDYGAMTIERTVYGKENWKAKARYFLKDNDDLEILDQYNSEIRGFAIQYVQNLCHQVPHQYAKSDWKVADWQKLWRALHRQQRKKQDPSVLPRWVYPAACFAKWGCGQHSQHGEALR